MSDWIVEGSRLKKYIGDDKKVVIPEEIKQVETGAFRDATNMRELVITKNVTALSGRAIYFCEKLERVDIESPELNMAFHTFQWCESLKTVNFNECETYIPTNCFNDCKSLEEIILPKSIRGIGDRAFSDCSNLKRIVIKNPDIALGDAIFDGASTSLEIEYVGDHNRFLELSKRKFYKKTESFGDYHHRDVYEVEVTMSDYPFSRFDQTVKTKVYCRADGVTLVFPSGKGKPEKR